MSPRRMNNLGVVEKHSCGVRRGFSMTEMLIVMAIMTILAGSLVVLVPGLRTRAMRAQAGADIHLISIAITQFREDIGSYPSRPYSPATPTSPGEHDYMDRYLFECLTNRNFDFTNPATAKPNAGWGSSKDNWEFLRGDSKALKQILDPWGVPYYYIPYTSYLLGVRVKDSIDSTPLVDTTGVALPNCYGTTPVWNDFRNDPDDIKPPPPGQPTDPDRYRPRYAYSSPQQLLGNFYNSTTFQIHSKGPDQRTDYYSDESSGDPATARAIIDACDRGQDPDDINNYGGGNAR